MATIQQSITAFTRDLTLTLLTIDPIDKQIIVRFDISDRPGDTQIHTIPPNKFIAAINFIRASTSPQDLENRIADYLLQEGIVIGTRI